MSLPKTLHTTLAYVFLDKSIIDRRRTSTSHVQFLTLPAHRHCEYHAFCAWQVYGLAHVVGPVQPLPPHCAQCDAVAEAVAVAVAVAVDTVVVVALVVVVEVEGAVVEVAVVVEPPELEGK